MFVDRYGYADGAKELETKLRNLLGTEPIISRNGRLCFFNMAAFKRRLKGGYTEEEWQEKHELAYYCPQVRWGPGFYAEETAGCDHWHWCGKGGSFEILNPSECPKQISLHFVARTCLAIRFRCTASPFVEPSGPLCLGFSISSSRKSLRRTPRRAD
jgi:hypothetical protein